VGPHLGENAGLDGVTRRIKQGLSNLVPLSIHHGLLVYIHAKDVLVDPEEVDDWIAVVHEDTWDTRNL
jgi:hypothetical protein